MMRGRVERAVMGLVGLVCLSISVPAAWSVEPSPRVTQLMKEARVYERAGMREDAIRIYERLLETEPEQRITVLRELVILYAKTGQREKALGLVEEIMRTGTDQQAFVAAVYTVLKEYKQAESILRRELKGEKRLERSLHLQWQLAEVLERAGQTAKAEHTLLAALQLAKGTPHELAATEQLKKFKAHRERAGKSQADPSPGAGTKLP